MANWKPFIELKTNRGKAIQKGDVTITPQAQALTIRLPYGGFVWNRPVAVVVEADGRRERIPIFDVTRAAVMAMASVSAIFMFSMAVVFVLSWGSRRR